METPINRMDTPAKRRGRPPGDKPEAPFVKAEIVELAPVMGLVCPCCGRGMEPRVVKTERLKRTLECVLCTRWFQAIYSDDGRPCLVKPLGN